MQLLSHRLHIITASLAHKKKNLYGTSRSYHEYGKKKKCFVQRIFTSDVVLLSTDDDVKFAFISFTVYVALCFAVLHFHDAALIKTPRTRRQGAQNILCVCHFAVPHLSVPQKVYQRH